MTLSRFEVFYTVVESGSLTKAGEILNLTQSGISHAITSLETELGFFLTYPRASRHLSNK
ncbi:hypothetical protein GCM10020331_001440 [Ectobacillus funiculus]